jgi:SAM-dependent methyltransferase
MYRNVSCIVCGSENYKRLYKSNFTASLENASDYFLSHRKKVAHGQILRCENCQFVYTSPQFSTEEYDLIYQKVLSKSDDLQHANNIRFTRLAKIVRRYIKSGSYLDFGCGIGDFLDVMDENQGVGFEVGKLGKRYSANGHKILTGNFFDLQGQVPFKDEQFSFITAFDVFEHLPDLPRYLERLRLLVRVGGYLIISVPNVNSLVARLTGEHWNMMLLEHLWYFSPETLKRTLDRYGFRHISTSSMSYAAPISHVFSRFSQTYQLPMFAFPQWLGSLTIPVPVGLMVSVFRRHE